MARRFAGGPLPAAAAGLLALVVFAGFLGLTLTADRLLREGPAEPLPGTRALTTSPNLAISATTLRRQAQSPSEVVRRGGTMIRAAVTSVGETIGPALVATAISAPVAAAVSALEPSGTTGEETRVAGLGDRDDSGKVGSRKGRKGSTGSSGAREPSDSLTASSDGKDGSKTSGRAGVSVAAAGAAERGRDNASG